MYQSQRNWKEKIDNCYTYKLCNYQEFLSLMESEFSFHKAYF